VNIVECTIDRERQLTVIRCVGDVDGPTVRARILAFWPANPETIDNNCLVDVRDYVGNLGYNDIRAIAMAWHEFAKGRDAGRRIAIVSRDRFAGLLVKVVARLFNTRQFALFHDVDDALRWLANRP
jgi:hypothetical protein